MIFPLSYGDRAPITVAGRLLAVFVILSGLVIFGLVNSIMATAITSITLDTDYKIYGAKVGNDFEQGSKFSFDYEPHC